MRAQDTYALVAARARNQHGVVSWAQLLAHGCLPTNVERWVQHRLLERVGPNTYVFAGSAPTWHQQVMVATLVSGGWASHRTAASLHRLDGHPGRIVEVTVERWKRSSQRNGFAVHETKDLRGVDLTTVAGIPCTSLVRTLIDLPAVEHRFRAEQALDDACRRHPDVLAQVRRRFVEVARRGRNGTAAMRAMLAERPGGSLPPASVFEAKMLRLIAGTSLPRPVKQHPVRDVGFVAYLDIAWPAIRFGVECDSLAYHSGKRAHEWDRERRRRLKLLGWDLVEYTYDDIVLRPDHVARELIGLYDNRVAQLLHA